MRSRQERDAPRRASSPRRRTQLNTYHRAPGKTTDNSPFRAKPVRSSARRYIFGFLDVILIIVIAAGLIYSLLVSPKPEVLVNSQVFHSEAQYQTYANGLFSELKNRNKITFDNSSVSSAMQKEFPEITTVSTELPIFSEQPTLRIGVAQPSLRVKSGNQNYIVDSQGVIVAMASGLPSARSLPQLIDQTGFHSSLGQPLLNSGAVEFIKTLVNESRASKVPILSLTLPPVAQELDLRTSDHPYFVKFYLAGDALTEAGQYLAARNHFNHTNEQPAQYLDVRVAGKVFYK